MNSKFFIILLVCPLSALSAATFVSHKSCNNVARGTIVANPGNCSQYIKCNGLRSTLGECPAASYFNERMLSCEKNVSACKIKEVASSTINVVNATSVDHLTTNTIDTITTPVDMETFTTALPFILLTPPTTTTAAVAVSTTLGRPICHAWFEQQFPHPNCEYYYHCVRGFLTVQRCTFGYGWDLEREHCVALQQARCLKLIDL